MTISIDPQIAGIQDDGTPEGVVRGKLALGELVRLPFSQTSHTFQINQNALGNVGFNTAQTFTNPDGTMTICSLANGGVGFQNGCEIWQPFYGRAFGLRFRRDANTPPWFCVMIDGVAYGVMGRDSQMMAEGFTGQTDEALVMIATDLPEIAPGQPAHKAVIQLVGDPANNYTLVLYGYLVERRAGYVEEPRLPVALLIQAVPVNTAAVNFYGVLPNMAVQTLRCIWLANTTASPITVSMAAGGASNQSTTPGTIIRQITVPANGEAILDFIAAQRLTNNASSRFWLYASAVGVNATYIGGS